uniref:MADF domain-containing protein n=1 Tax=Glossina brevipalpis TaxID=37001 RepID=A0A1A9WJK1_9MUSC
MSVYKFINLAHYNDIITPRRGRPRSLPAMGEFDLSLINEFRSRPSFYDRNCPKFKDKIYTAHQWQEISNKLGFDVSILKDRMLQLRNRYNLEKRRLEQLREENPSKPIESPWPLYEHLHFLSDHIRARRSYKKMVPLQSQSQQKQDHQQHHPQLRHLQLRQQTDASSSGCSGSFVQLGQTFPNTLLSVKMEEDDSEEQDTDADTESNDRDDNIAFEPSTILSEAQQIHSTTRTQQEQNSITTGYQPTITIRRLDTLRSPEPIAVEKPNKKRSYQCTQPAFFTEEPPTTTHQKEPCLSSRELRYIAFGNFVSSSLQDLPQNAALELVEKFTSEIVKSLLEKSEDFNGFPSD